MSTPIYGRTGLDVESYDALYPAVPGGDHIEADA
jgi:hypothetical protein